MTVLFLPPSALAPAQALPRDPFRLYLANLANAESRRAMAACLHRVAALVLTASGIAPGDAPAASFPWGSLTAEHTALVRALIAEQQTSGRDGSPRLWSPAYRNKHLSAVRGVLQSAWVLGDTTADVYHRARAVKNFKGTRLPTGRSIHAEEFAALLRVCAQDPTPAGRRDAALLALLYTTGARRAEIAALRREHYDPGERSLRIIGKGDKQRTDYLHPHAAALLGAWLALDDVPTGPMLKPVHRSGSIHDRALTSAAIRNALVKRRQQAQLPAMTPHDFRRTFIGNLLDLGTDLATVQHLVGHASPVTTSRYDRRPERRRRDAVDSLAFPAPEQIAAFPLSA